MSASRYFLLKRLHSLTGVFPIGFFLLEHFYSNSLAISGPWAYDQNVLGLQTIPFLLFLEILFIWIPILFHGLLGVYLIYLAKYDVVHYPYSHHIYYFFQRLTGIGVLLFIAWHFYETRLSFDLERMDHHFHVSIYQQMRTLLMTDWKYGAYLVGVAMTCYHFGNGLWSFFVTWGITISPQSQRLSRIVCLALGGLLLVLSWWSLAGFRATF